MGLPRLGWTGTLNNSPIKDSEGPMTNGTQLSAISAKAQQPVQYLASRHVTPSDQHWYPASQAAPVQG